MPRLRIALSILGLLLLEGLLLALTWKQWPDPFIDSGNEIYTAWRLAEGDVLYRDVARLHGPVSPYFNAAVLKLAGVSILNLEMLNAALLAVNVALPFLLGARTASPCKLRRVRGLPSGLCLRPDRTGGGIQFRVSVHA